MKPTWYLLQYTPDQRRHETRNVGVVVTDGEDIAARFLGEDSGDSLDLRRVPRWIESRQAYRTWVEHWREAIRESNPDRLPESLVPRSRPGKYVVLPPRGPLLEVPQQGMRELARQLFDELVAADLEQLDEPKLQDLCDDALEPIENRRGIVFARDKRLPAPIDDDHEQPLQFHYAARNGKWHYMRRINLGGADASTWDRVAATLFHFDRLHRLANFEDANRITLTMYDEASGGDLEDQLAALEKESYVVNVANRDAARQTLIDMIAE